MSVAIEICREAVRQEASSTLVAGLLVFALYVGLDVVVGFLAYASSGAEVKSKQKVYGV